MDKPFINIKICGIRDAATATEVAKAGADFIGIVFHPSSPRYVNVNQAMAIRAATIKAGAIPVAIFVHHNADEMRYICKATQIQTVQLHGPVARAHHHLLPETVKRIYVQTVSAEGAVETDAGIKYLDPARDFILLDHAEPGQGKAIQRDGFHYHLPFPWILAGGLTPMNVASAITELQPDGVDVASGVERIKGHKEMSLIKQFIAAARGEHVA